MSLPPIPLNVPPAEAIRLEDIDIENDSFRMSFQPDLTRLTASMLATGLINPIILRGRAPFHIISGYRRVLAARSLGWVAIDARVYAEKDIDDKTALRITFYENLGTRAFNLIEAAHVAIGFSLKGNINSEEVRQTILPLMGIQSGNKVFQQLLSLAQLSADWKSFVVQKGIALPNAAKVARFTHEEQKLLYRVFSVLKLGHNKMSQCLDMIEDIRKREQGSIKALLGSDAFTSVLNHETLNTSEKTMLFRRALHAKRYPEFSRTQKHFHQLRKTLALPREISLEPPPFFEGNRLTISSSFRSTQELRSIAAALQAAADSEALSKMLEML